MCPIWPNLYFNWTFRNTNSFVKIRLVLEIKNVASFIKARFYLKRGCIKMRKHAETFHANKGCHLATVFLYQFRRFQNRNLGAILKRFFHENVVLQTPTFYMKMNYFDIVFYITWEEWQRFQSLRSSFSKTSVLSSGPGPVFKRCPKRLAVWETSKTECTH